MAPVLQMQQAAICTDPRTAFKKPLNPAVGRKCKIVCTLGPACKDALTLAKLVDAGMDACCISFSTETKEAHVEALEQLQQALAMRPGKRVAVILDARGAEIRTGALKSGGVVNLKAGSTVKLVTDTSIQGDESCVAVSCRRLPSLVKPGGHILSVDGSMVLEVVSCGSGHVMAKVVSDCRVSEGKKCILPGVRSETAGLSESELRELASFAISHRVDFVTAGCAQGVVGLRHVQESLGEEGWHVGVLAKVDSAAGLLSFDDILGECDGVIVSRGDLGAQVSPEKVFLAQKALIAKCNAVGKPVVVASQLLESMVSSPLPTRADASDVANAALDGADALLLSEATANGDFPEAAAALARRSCEEAENVVDQGAVLAALQRRQGEQPLPEGSAEAACLAAAEAACGGRARLVLALDQTGRLARLVAQHRPRVPVVAVTCSDRVARQVQLSRGADALLLAAPPSDAVAAVQAAEQAGHVRAADLVVVVQAVEGADGGAGRADGEGSTVEVRALMVGGGSTDMSAFLRQALLPQETHPAVTQAKVCVKGSLGCLAAESAYSGQRKCKIICTIGPKCSSVPTLVKLIDAGMDVCRLNFSYGDHASHAACVRRIREAAALRPNRTIAIQLDTKGPEIRTGLLQNGGTVALKAGDNLKLVTDYSIKGDATCIAVSYRKLPWSVRPGMTILLASGGLALEVVSCDVSEVNTKVLNNFTLGERQNINLPGVQVDLPVLQLKDRDDLCNFAIRWGVDFVAASFVQSAADVRFVREVLGQRGKDIKIISKIENEAGLRNFDEILAETDGVMVARGDLGMEISPEKVFMAQKTIIGKCNAVGKPVITGTHLLRSMAGAPRPTQAEVADVANAVLDGTDCLMLSGETATGEFPEEAVRAVRRICAEAEAVAEPGAAPRLPKDDTPGFGAAVVAASAVELAAGSGAKLIMVQARAELAQQVARLRPQVPVLAVSEDPTLAKHLALSRGVIPMCVESLGADDAVEDSVLLPFREAKRMGILAGGETVVVVRDGGAEVRTLPQATQCGAFVDGLRKLRRPGAAPAPAADAADAQAEAREVEQPAQRRGCAAGVCKLRRSAATTGADVTVAPGDSTCSDEGGAPQEQAQGKGCAAGVCKLRCPTVTAGVDITAAPADSTCSGDGIEPQGPAQGKGCAAGICKLRRPTATGGADLAAAPADSTCSGDATGPHEPAQGKGCAAGICKLRRPTAAVESAATEDLACPGEGSESQGPAQGKGCAAGVISKLRRSTATGGADLAAAPADSTCSGDATGPQEPAQGKGCAAGICKLRRPMAAVESVATEDLACPGEGNESQGPAQSKGCAAGVISKLRRSTAADASAASEEPPYPGEGSGSKRPVSCGGCAAGVCKLRRPAPADAAEATDVAREGGLAAGTFDDVVGEASAAQQPGRGRGCAAGVCSLRNAAASAAAAAAEGAAAFAAGRRTADGEAPEAQQPARGKGCAAGVCKAATAAGAAVAGAEAAESTGPTPRRLRRLSAVLAAAGQATAALAAGLVTPRVGQPKIDEFGVQFLAENSGRLGVVVLDSGLQYKVLRKGLGAEHPAQDSLCLCHFEGRLVRQWPDGQVFESTYCTGEPAELCPNEVIAGWAEAMQMMVEGDKWEVYVHPDLAYGEQGSQPHVAGGDVLVFTIELVEIRGERTPAVRRSLSRMGEKRTQSSSSMQALAAAALPQAADAGAGGSGQDLVAANALAAMGA